MSKEEMDVTEQLLRQEAAQQAEERAVDYGD